MDTMQAQVRMLVALLTKRPITEATVMQIKSVDGYQRLEVVDGEWVGLHEERDEITTGEEHGWIETLLLLLLGQFVVANRLGRVYPGDVTFVLDGDPDDIRLMREPDVTFVRQANVTPTPGFIYRAPDLAVEIVSPSQSLETMVSKANEYFAHDTAQVWLVLPTVQQIQVYTPDGKMTAYRVGDTVPGGDLLPGFRLEVAAIFESGDKSMHGANYEI